MPYLIRNSGTPDERTFTLDTGVTTIGRDRDNQICLDSEKSISRHHAEIVVDASEVTIRDQGSLNSTFVNETKITRSVLNDGDTVRCGEVAFEFVQSLPLLPFQDTSENLSILKRFSLEESRFFASNPLQPQERQKGAVLKIQAHNTEDKFKILLEVGKQLSSPEEPDKLLEKILDLLFDLMDIDRAAILMVNEVTGELEPKAIKSKSTLVSNCFYSQRIANFVRDHGDAILTADARVDERFNDSDSVLQQSIQASLSIPLKPRDKVIGVLYADNLSDTNLYSQEDLEFLTALANQAAIAIENATLYKQMQAEALMRVKLERFFPQAVSRKIKEEGGLDIVDTEVTALFSDISGFTTMSSTMEPRQVIEMLNEYFKVMVEDIVFRYEGTLEKYIGDALLAIWGAPYQKPNDVEQAVWAAIAMQKAAHQLNEQWAKQRGLDIHIHIGVNTGKVAAGNIGSEKLFQYATIGDTTNVTSRICNVAQADEIMVSQATIDKLQDPTLPIEPMPLVTVKGKEQPLQLYRLLWQQV